MLLLTRFFPVHDRYTSVQYVPTMRHRLKLLRENSEKLGLIGSTDAFAAMTHWGSVMASARKIVDGGQGSMCLHFLDSPKNRCILRAYPVQGKRHQHPALKVSSLLLFFSYHFIYQLFFLSFCGSTSTARRRRTRSS